MKKADTRKLNAAVQEQIRIQAVRLRKSGREYKEIAEILSVSHTKVCAWYKKYEKDGIRGIQAQKRGRRTGSCRTLNAAQEKQIRKMIRDKCPDQLKLPFALWTRIAVQQLIREIFSIDMPVRTVGEYLKRWGFTPQKPLRRAYEQNPKAVQEWLNKTFPVIKERAAKENGEIQWGDETGLCNDCQHGRSFSPRGKTPAVRLPAKREKINLISSITNQGKVRFMIYKDMMNARVLIKFMKRLIRDSGRKIFLILDNLRVHHANIVNEWVNHHRDEIELFHLPSYSPELNPDEYLNCDLKAGVHSGVPARTKDRLQKKAFSHLRMLQKKPKRVKKYFKHPSIAYAA